MENIKFTVYNEVEKHILALRDSKTVAELEEIVNTYLDKILIRIKEQLPELNRKELIFLTYLYAWILSAGSVYLHGYQDKELL